ncbi:MAG: carbohydrate-binding domain-containing protein, partial [Clostridia bacterium]|nr:carbohydrate-binding domain-containing protein [Clostridia bacterium]
LEGVKISNPSNPVIFFENSEKSLITISKGTENYITDGEEYALEAKAAVFSNDDIEIKGEGKLYVTSKAHHALASDDDIKIEEGTMVLVSEKKDGIHANNTIKITGGNISVTAFGDGIQSEEDVVIEGGNISVTTNGTVAQSSNNPWGGGMPQGGRGGRTRQNQADWDNGQAQSTGEMTPPEGMEGMTPPQGGMPTSEMTPPKGMEGMMPPEGGRPMGEITPPEGMEGMTPPQGMEIMMPPEDGNQAPTEDEATATKGIKAETNISITGGKISVDAADHAIHCAATISITGGEIELSSKAGKGISAHGDVVIDNGEIRVIKASEGLESKANFTINGGKIEVNATDDGINAGGTGGRDVANRRDAEAQTGHDLIINGGTVFVNAQGDGLDANGRMIINGGDIVVEGPTNSGNGALDSGGVIRVNGGTVIALGASGMAEVPDNESGQPAFRLVTDQNIAQNTTITIKSESGDVLYSYTTKKTGNSIVFSSHQLKVGDKYTVTIGDSVHTVEMTSNVTSVGNGGMGGFGGGRRW